MRTKKECVFPGGKERSIYSQLLIWQMSNPGLSSHRVSFFFFSSLLCLAILPRFPVR